MIVLLYPTLLLIGCSPQGTTHGGLGTVTITIDKVNIAGREVRQMVKVFVCRVVPDV